MRIFITLICLFLVQATMAQSNDRPSLILTAAGVNKIKANLGTVPLFDKTLEEAMHEVDKEILLGVQVPIPVDMAGGYSHERHKRNFFILQKAGNIYQITGEEKYAKYVKDCLLAYAEMYPTLPLHPTMKSYATGKIFWQCLNDANWLVYVSQAYDCIYNYLTQKERKVLEEDLFIPFANFLSIENPKFFNRIHNHSTWANAAVGMIGLAMNHEELIQRALYGLSNDGIDQNEVDNDGGFLKIKGVQKAGFLAQLDYSFSPDGYFSEGPYYLRYAIFPFLVFGKALQNKKPELDIFNYRDEVLSKAVDALLQLSDSRGLFFSFNDALKGMSINAREIVTAVDAMYYYKEDNADLLSIVEKQNKVVLDETGFKVAQALKEGKVSSFQKRSITFGDGKDGNEGGVGVVRAEDLDLVFKYSAQGMGHGHFDKLSIALHDAKGEVLQDYGAVRWVNVDQKGGGRYLPENRSFGKQTIGHNTLVVDEVSHYEASVKKGEAAHPVLYNASIDEANFQILSAIDSTAYKGVKMHRTLISYNDEALIKPIIIDVFRADAQSTHQYDLPYWYMGHLLSTSQTINKESSQLNVLGKDYGYQHLWYEGNLIADQSFNQMCWMANNNFYTISTAGQEGDEFIFARAGANDPNFNLRPEQVYIQRRTGDSNTCFINVIESHGTYDPVTEIPLKPFSQISGLKTIRDDAEYTVVEIELHSKEKYILFLSQADNTRQKNHSIIINQKEWTWQGVSKIFKIK